MKLMVSLSDEKMKRDAEILTSAALNFLIELGGDVRAFKNDRKLIA